MIVSVVMLRTGSLVRAAGYVGVLWFLAAVANDASRLLAPSLAAILMPLNGLLWLIWIVLTSIGLLWLARSAPDETAGG
jgi:hypothetical protein